MKPALQFKQTSAEEVSYEGTISDAETNFLAFTLQSGLRLITHQLSTKKWRMWILSRGARGLLPGSTLLGNGTYHGSTPCEVLPGEKSCLVGSFLLDD